MRPGVILIVLSLLTSPAVWADPSVTLGIDVLLGERIDLVEGKRVGLVTNASGVDGDLVPTADRLARDPRVQLVRLYAPEHGLRGAVRAGKKIADEVDPATGVPVQSLFGARRAPSPESLSGLDVLLFDIQDVGSRTYTYTSTMAEAMVAAARAGVPFVVLDRPNPLGGRSFEGPIRQRRFKSFVGWGPVPVSHGMTAGELARFYAAAEKVGRDPVVVTMKGWRRDMVWQDTGLTWVPTSPGIPHARHAHLYIATGMVGGVTRNVNEGVGTTMPFELVGAPFVDGDRLAVALNAAGLPGVRFRAISYRPYYGRFQGKRLQGVQLILRDSDSFQPLRTALTIHVTLERLYPGRVQFRKARSFGRIWGNTDVMERIRAGQRVEEIEATWAADLKVFARERAPFLLYP